MRGDAQGSPPLRLISLQPVSLGTHPGAPSKLTTAFRGFRSWVSALPTVLSHDILATKQSLLNYHLQEHFSRSFCTSVFLTACLLQLSPAKWPVINNGRRPNDLPAFDTDLQLEPTPGLSIKRSSSYLGGWQLWNG